MSKKAAACEDFDGKDAHIFFGAFSNTCSFILERAFAGCRLWRCCLWEMCTCGSGNGKREQNADFIVRSVTVCPLLDLNVDPALSLFPSHLP